METINRVLVYLVNSLYFLRIRGKTKLKVQFGCGDNKIPGWVNSDYFNRDKFFTKRPDVFIDITQGLPFKNNSCSFLYAEHLIEHVTIDESNFFLREANRILTKGGVLRLSTPDLKYLVNKYISKDWKKQDWLTWPAHKFIKTPAEMLNISFRWWDHKYLYDETEIIRRLKEAGFTKIKRVLWGKSRFLQLKGLETRKDSKLIIEAIK